MSGIPRHRPGLLTLSVGYMKMKRYIQTFLSCLLLVACTTGGQSYFDVTCKKLAVRPHIQEVLADFLENRGGDNREHFELLRAFCVRRQTAYSQAPDPILDPESVITLLGKPDEQSQSATWIYYFNPENTWNLELSFKDGELFYTHYRQLMTPEELTESVLKK